MIHLLEPALSADRGEAYRPGGDGFVRIAALGSDDATAFDNGTVQVLASKATAANEPLRIGDTTTAVDGEIATPYGSLLAIPLAGHGFLLFASEEPDGFDEDVLPIADIVGEYVLSMLEDCSDTAESPEGTANRSIPDDLTQQVPEDTSDLVVVLDTSGTVTFASKAARQLLAEDSRELVGTDWIESAFVPEDRDAMRDTVQAVLAGETDPVARSVGAVTTADGGTRRIEWHLLGLRNEDGELTGVLTSGVDVTDTDEDQAAHDFLRERVQTLLDIAPDPILVADVDTGELLEANDAAGDLLCQSPSAIIGRDLTTIHPPERRDTYAELFEQCSEYNEPIRRLPDGSPLEVVTAAGEPIPVEINSETFELANRRVVFGIFRDIRGQVGYEHTLQRLNDVAATLFDVRTRPEVATEFVDATLDVLGFETAGVYLYDDTACRLEPVTVARAGTDLQDDTDLPAVGPGEGIVWQIFNQGEQTVVHSASTDSVLADAGAPTRSELLLPLGDHGVAIIGNSSPDGIDGRLIELTELLAATTSAVLSRIERERQQKESEQRLQQRTQELESVAQITRSFQNLAREVAKPETRESIEQTACEEIVESESIAFAWIGERDASGSAIEPRAWAGSDAGYLQSIDLDINAEQAEPAMKAVTEQAPAIVDNTAKNLPSEAWRDEAVRRGFRAAAGFPIVYQEQTLGVLTVYATQEGAFDELLRSTLESMSDIIAHAITASGRSQALVADNGTELEFELRDPKCFFLRLAEEFDCSFDLDRIVPESDGTWTITVAVTEACESVSLERARQADEIATAQLLESADDPRLQLTFSEPFLVSELANHGIVVREISATTGSCRVTVGVPSNMASKTAADVVSSIYADSSLVAKRQQADTPSCSGEASSQFVEQLTDRQREVLTAAYRQGYFKSPRDASGEEIATSIGISNSAFHDHLRAAERKLIDIAIADDRQLSDAD